MSTDEIDLLISSLKCCPSPGPDGILAAHLKYGNSLQLRSHLSALYSIMFYWSIVPSIFNTGIIIPILKKSTLNPNDPNNYRPITLSSVFAKMAEMFMIPEDKVHDNQFGFRKGRNTSLCGAMLNDILAYFVNGQSPVFICSLDAEKCFDLIWHNGLFYKLWDSIPRFHWLFLYQWYSRLEGIICWNGIYSKSFRITRGTRQGSVISPFLFNIFIDDLMKKLDNHNSGLNIGDVKYNSFAYADDVTLFSSTTTGLQNLISICADYAKEWRFGMGGTNLNV